MSDYGADKKPSIPAAQNLAWTKHFLPLRKTNVMQWTYPDDVIVRKLAHRKTGSNVLFKFGPVPPDPVIPPDLPPVPAGVACTVCWGDGLPFGVGETPSKITVVVQDVEEGPDWLPGFGLVPNGTFELTQQGGIPCRYNFGDADFDMTLVFGPGGSGITILSLPFFIASFFATGIDCQTFYENTVTDFFINGTATIFIPPIL